MDYKEFKRVHFSYGDISVVDKAIVGFLEHIYEESEEDLELDLQSICIETLDGRDIPFNVHKPRPSENGVVGYLCEEDYGMYTDIMVNKHN